MTFLSLMENLKKEPASPTPGEIGLCELGAVIEKKSYWDSIYELVGVLSKPGVRVDRENLTYVERGLHSKDYRRGYDIAYRVGDALSSVSTVSLALTSAALTMVAKSGLVITVASSPRAAELYWKTAGVAVGGAAAVGWLTGSLASFAKGLSYPTQSPSQRQVRRIHKDVKNMYSSLTGESLDDKIIRPQKPTIWARLGLQ